MKNPWPAPPPLQRLIVLVLRGLVLRGEFRFQKYQVASRPGAETLRRRLLLRLRSTSKAHLKSGKSKPERKGPIMNSNSMAFGS